MPPVATTPAAIRVLVIGPKYTSAHSRGGMASVVTLMREQRDPRVRITTVATFVDDPAIARLATGVLGLLHSVLLLATHRVDVLHVHLAHKGSVLRKAVALLTAQAFGVPAIVHAHSYDFIGWYDGLSPRVQRVVRRALPAKRWLVLGDALADQYAKCLDLPRERVRALRNPADFSYESVPRPPTAVVPGNDERVRALFLGRHGERKGSYDLIKALARLTPSTRAALTVAAAGDGDVAEVRAAALAARVDDVLTVLPWVDAPTRDELLATSDILVLPSHDEGLPMALLEAMARGLAPLTTPVGGIPELVTDGIDGMLVPPGDIEALAGALESLVNDPELRRAIGRAARSRAGDFDSGRWFAALIDEWTRLVRPAVAA